LGDPDGLDDKSKTIMKNLNNTNREQLTELVAEGRIVDSLDLCRIICDHYSKYEGSAIEGDPERFKMAVLSNEGREIYCVLSFDWELYVPYRKIATASMELDFKVLVFAASWDGFNTMAKRIKNLPTKCTVKVFAVKRRGEDWDKGIIPQLIDWIENDTIPAEWKEEVKCKTIKR
jgi:hypothetical protein